VTPAPDAAFAENQAAEELAAADAEKAAKVTPAPDAFAEKAAAVEELAAADAEKAAKVAPAPAAAAVADAEVDSAQSELLQLTETETGRDNLETLLEEAMDA
ncbi:unnamed protein product, partial [Effrenium voratum]